MPRDRRPSASLTPADHRRAAAAEQAERYKATRAGEHLAPEHWQEGHSPTEPVIVTISSTRTRQQGRRRRSDARLWEAMSPEQERAAAWILAAVQQLVGDVAVRTQRFERRSRGRPGDAEPERNARVQQAYRAWVDRCIVEDLVAADVIQILVYGESLSDQDRRRRQRNGRAKEHLFGALDLFARMQGWIGR